MHVMNRNKRGTELLKTYSSVPSKGATIGGAIVGAILTAPLLLSVYLFSQGQSLFSLSLFCLLSFVLVFMGYIIYSGVNMKYIIGDDKLILKIGFHEQRIPYSYIKEIRLENLSLIRLRIFGASWPGFLWGLFTIAGVGAAHLYCTRWRGDFVLIELRDGKKIGITPEKQIQFIDEVRKKAKVFSRARMKEAFKLKTHNRLVYSQVVLVIAAYVVLAAYFFSVYPMLPDTIPVHFDIYGNPNRWASKSELFLMLLLAAIFPVLNTFLTLKFGKHEKIIAFFLGITFILIITVFFGAIDCIVRASMQI